MILQAHFPCLKTNEDRLTTMYEFIKDLTSEQFRKGIRIFCEQHKEIFPNTNITAYIREYGQIEPDKILIKSRCYDE